MKAQLMLGQQRKHRAHDFAAVVAEGALVQVGLQVLCADLIVNSGDPPLSSQFTDERRLGKLQEFLGRKEFMSKVSPKNGSLFRMKYLRRCCFFISIATQQNDQNQRRNTDAHIFILRTRRTNVYEDIQ
jgi:hypothetical protein